MRLKDIDNFPLLPNKLDGDESEYEKGYRDATANLNALPTIDPESLRPTGEWETANDGTSFCPHCGCDAPYTWDDIDRNFINSADDVPDRPSNYCPNCGAKTKEATHDQRRNT